MTTAILRIPAAVAAAALALGAAGAEAQGRGGGHGFHGGGFHGGGFHGGGFHGGYGFHGGGYGGWRGYGWGWRGYGAPYWGWYGYAPWYAYPGPYYPGYYDYDYEPYPPPPPADVAPPPPPPAPVERPAPPRRAEATSKSFIVYFPFDDANLTAEARRVASDAARYAADRSAERVTIVGYTDAAGSEGYNQDLSERRSRAVREALAADGVPQARIDMAWHGKHDQAVRTPDGVREPANRRVTVVVGTAYADQGDEADNDQDYDDSGRDDGRY